MALETILANSENYEWHGGRTADYIGWIVVHYTGNRGDTARGNCRYFQREQVGTSAHFFVDEGGALCSIPPEFVAYHCGTRGEYRHKQCRNRNSIGVEICMLDRAGNLRPKAIAQGAKLVRELCKRYNVPPDRVLRHYDVTGKKCPAPFVDAPKLWDLFLKEVGRQEMYTVYKSIKDVPAWAQECVRDLIGKGYLKGDGDGSLDLEHYMLRGLVINWRAGLYK